MDSSEALVVFQDKKIRSVWHEGQWYFSVVDVVNALEASTIPKRYWSDLKIKLSGEGSEVYDKIVQLKLPASDGKSYETDCANTESMFRIIQSIPSPKAEPFKQWLAKVGYERIQEIENPELAQKRMKELYKLKGYSEEWIEKRARGIALRDELTDEWSKREVKTDLEYAILTSEISKATFGLTPKEYKDLKKLRNENLRDHMTDMELIFSMLGEASTATIARGKDAKGFFENRLAAEQGGKVAGNAREELEQKSGEKIVTPENYLDAPEGIKRLAQKSQK